MILDWLAFRDRIWIEGSVLYRRRIGTQHADLARSVSVQLRCNRESGAQLVVRDHTGASACAELLSLPPAMIRSASPAALQRLAASLSRAPAPGAAAVGRLLQRQAQYVLAGSPLERCPLLPFATGRYGRLMEGSALIGLIGRS